MTAASTPNPLYNQAVEVVRNYGRASISLVQRKLHIGYIQAAALLTRMEADGVIDPLEAGWGVRDTTHTALRVIEAAPCAPDAPTTAELLAALKYARRMVSKDADLAYIDRVIAAADGAA